MILRIKDTDYTFADKELLIETFPPETEVVIVDDGIEIETCTLETLFNFE